MPLKVYLQIFAIILAGLILVSYLIYNLVKSLKKKRSLPILRDSLFILLLTAFGLWLAYTFIPCFSPIGSVFCQGPSEKKWVALTFDDGPNEPYTTQILEILKQYQVPATFFMVGKNIERSPEIVQTLIREGYPIGNHTYTHQVLNWKSEAEIRQEIQKWEEVIRPIGTPAKKIFRAPHGWKSLGLTKVLNEKGYEMIGWSRGVWDTDRPGEEILFKRLTSRITPGEILLLHDGGDDQQGVDRSQLVSVLPKVIEYYQNQGFQFVSLSQMMDTTPQAKPSRF